MFLSKRTSGIYHLYYHKTDGKLTSISTKAKIKSKAHLFLIDFTRQLEERFNWKPDSNINVNSAKFSTAADAVSVQIILSSPCKKGSGV
jgi:hypothetical protein